MTFCRKRSSAGFSLVELLAVVAILFILVSVAVHNLAAARRNIKTDLAANIVFSLLQQARQSAITNRLQHRVTITRNPDPSNDHINLMRIAAISQADGTANIIREEYLPQDVLLARPPSAALVGSPRPIPDEAVFDASVPNGSFTLIYNVDGSITDAAGNPLTSSIFFSDIPLGRNLTLTRAISFYSSTGEVKYWFYDGAKFD